MVDAVDVGEYEAKATKELQELEQQHDGLATNLTKLKEEVRMWQDTIEQEATQHRESLDQIRQKLKDEVETLRSEFEEIKKGMQRELEDLASTTDPIVVVMGKGGTRFVSEPIAVRAGRQRQTFSARELEQDMVVFQETGVHPEVERAMREHDYSPQVKPLPDFNQNRPFVFLEFAIAKNPVGRITVELFSEHNPSGVELMLNRCRSGSQDSLAKTSVHKLFTEFAFFFGKTNGTQQLTPHPNLNHIDKGTVSVSLDGSEIAITLTKDMTGLDSTHRVLGRVHLGVGILDQINDVISGPLDIPVEEITITHCGMTNHEGAIGESSGTKDTNEEVKTIKDSKKQLEEESKTTHSNLQSALVEGLHREQEHRRSKRKRNLLHHFSSSSSDSDD